MRQSLIERWFLFMLASWIGGILLAAEFARNQADFPTSSLSPPVGKPAVPGDTKIRPLHLQGKTSRWALPIEDHRGGWLVAVGSTSTQASPRRFQFSSKLLTSGTATTSSLSKFISFDNQANPFVHTVLRPKTDEPVLNSGSFLQNRVKRPPVARRAFAIQTRSGDSHAIANYESISSTLTRSSLTTNIYVDDRDQVTVKPETIDAIVRIMDETIPAQVVPKIGSATDTDGDGRFTILISQALGRMGDGTTTLDGFVRVADFEPGGVFPRSHSADMLYINSRAESPEFLKSLLAHEYTHAVVAGERLKHAENNNAAMEESWLDEGLAHLSERWVDGSWENLDYRISSYLLDTHEHPLVINDVAGLGPSRGHGHRGAAYLFLAWCESNFGEDFARRIAQGRECGVINLEDATGHRFTELFRAWSAHLVHRASGMGQNAEIRSQALLNDWLVATPRATFHMLDASASTPNITHWQSPATSVRLFRLMPATSQKKPGVVEISLETDSPDEVQVTVMPLEDRHLGLEVEVEAEATAKSGQESVPAVRLKLTNRDTERPLTLQAAAWETMTNRGDARKTRERRGFIDLLGMARTFGTVQFKPGQTVVSPPIPLDHARFFTGRIAWKIVAHDPSGKPQFAWAEMPIHEVETNNPGPLGLRESGQEIIRR